MEYEEIEYAEDCKKIRNVLVLKGFPNATTSDACRLWLSFSESYDASWMALPEHPELIYKDIKPFLI